MRDMDAQPFIIDIKMPSEAPVLPTQTEKPHHYTYLKEFRTQQCSLFLQHKCTQHRPFTCFHWHFMNQRRRRPIRKRDGTFNYNPDVYCTKYDETTGICPDGDECPFLHRTAGDTERRYHLRYYKTGTCVHETDARGHCVKNGPHCAFAHGANDLRPPVYDIRELQLMEQAEKSSDSGSLGTTPSSLEKEKILNEDPKWNDTNYVLANYKTEQCKRPPRLCRQGYACPQYHNSRDRRRSPKKFKYRSTPCPNVKHGDDWGDPNICENGDNCPYCHTRTEQQFHPEIYKSTKCNDMVQTGYCPRGPFCAFAHVEQEMTSQREIAASANSSLAAYLTNALPESHNSNSAENSLDFSGTFGQSLDQKPHNPHSGNNRELHLELGRQDIKTRSISETSPSISGPVPEPIGKGRSSSTSGSGLADSNLYFRAPGSERDDCQQQAKLTKLRQQIQAIENDPTLDVHEKTKRKHNLMMIHNLNGSPSPGTLNSPSASSTMSPLAAPFFPAGDTVESVIGNVLTGNALEDLSLEDFDLSSIDKELERDNDTNSVCSSLSAGFTTPAYVGATSAAVNIPTNGVTRGSLGSLSQESPPSSLGSLPPAFVPQHIQQQQKQEQQIEQAAAAFLSHPNPGKFSAPGVADFNSMSPRSSSSGVHSPLISQTVFANTNNELQRLRDELSTNKAKLQSWEEGINQARSACDAWKKEAEESIKKAKASEDEKAQLIGQRDEAIVQKAKLQQEVTKLKQDIERLSGGPFMHCLKRVSELETLPLTQLKNIQQQLRLDLDRLDKIVYQYTAMKCMVCQEKNRSVAVMPCNHYVLCDMCAPKRTECPYCHSQITQRSNIVLPL